MNAASGRQRIRGATDTRFDLGLYFEALRLGEYIGCARQLFYGDSPWPKHLAQPQDVSDENSPEWLNNICLGVLSWITPHEIGHVYHGDDVVAPYYVTPVSPEYDR